MTLVCGGLSGLFQCGTDFPSDFCCPSATKCTPLNTTDKLAVICCPAGTSCSSIQPITCDMTQYNATLHPDNQLHIAAEGFQLEACGASCCPPSYSCKDGFCAILPESVTSSTVASSTTVPSSTPTSDFLATTTPKTTKNDTKVIVLGSAIGGLALIILVIIALYFLRWRKLFPRQSKLKLAGEENWEKAELDDTQRRLSQPRATELDANREPVELSTRKSGKIEAVELPT